MKKTIQTLLFSFMFLVPIVAQTGYHVVDFATRYNLEYIIADESKEESPEYFIIRDILSEKIVLEYGDPDLKDLAHNNLSERTKIYVNQMPQHNIEIGDDYNFDGVKDILIYDWETLDEGCYYPQKDANIFLSTTHGNFVYNKSLSEKFRETNCLRGGYLYADAENKEICTEISGGAMSYYKYCYIFSNDTLKPVKELSEDGLFNFLYGQKKVRELINGKWKTSSTYFFRREMPEPLFAFETLNKKGRVFLFCETFYDVNDRNRCNHNNRNNLYYVFMTDNETITFAYPIDPEKMQGKFFSFNEDCSELTFNSGSVKYIIYENHYEFGIRIFANGKVHDWKGNVSTKEGSLFRISRLPLKNLLGGRSNIRSTPQR